MLQTKPGCVTSAPTLNGLSYKAFLIYLSFYSSPLENPQSCRMAKPSSCLLLSTVHSRNTPDPQPLSSSFSGQNTLPSTHRADWLTI